MMRFLPALMVCLFVSSSNWGAESAASGRPKFPLGSTVFRWEELVATPTAKGTRRNVANQPSATVAAQEASHAAHRHPDDEIVIIKEGAVEVSIEGKTQLATAGSVCFFSSNDLHGMRNAGNSRATYYVIRAVTTATPKAAK